MNKKEYERVTMQTFVLPTEDIVSTSYDSTANDMYSSGWTDGNLKINS